MVAAASGFSVVHRKGDAARSLTHDVITQVTAPLDGTVVLVGDEEKLLCIVSLNIANLRGVLPAYRGKLAGVLEIPEVDIAFFVSHNHCDVELAASGENISGDSALTDAGTRFLTALVEVAGTLRAKMVPVTVRFGKGECTSISYIRKGRRHDGTTYFMREEDRKLLAEDYTGEIDPDAPVVSLVDGKGTPVCHFASFTAHPVTAYHPEKPIVAAEYCQIASRFLSDWTGGAPVAFVQGFAGDTNSKRFLTLDPPIEKVLSSTLYGAQLGAAFARAVYAEESKTDRFLFDRRFVRLPFDKPPTREETRAAIEEIEAFFDRCAAGDEDTLECVGLNPSRTMSPRYRTSLLAPVYAWYQWVEGLHQGEDAVADGVDIDLLTVRLGDVAIIGIAGEPFSTIGLDIKAASPASLTITGGYFNGCSEGYIPDGKNHRDLDYVSSFYRYIIGNLPFADPAGDRLAEVTLQVLNQLFSS